MREVTYTSETSTWDETQVPIERQCSLAKRTLLFIGLPLAPFGWGGHWIGAVLAYVPHSHMKTVSMTLVPNPDKCIDVFTQSVCLWPIAIYKHMAFWLFFFLIVYRSNCGNDSVHFPFLRQPILITYLQFVCVCVYVCTWRAKHRFNT